MKPNIKVKSQALREEMKKERHPFEKLVSEEIGDRIGIQGSNCINRSFGFRDYCRVCFWR